MKPKLFLIDVVERRTVPVLAHSQTAALEQVAEHSERGTGFWEEDAVRRSYEHISVARELADVPKHVRQDPSELIMYTDAAESALIAAGLPTIDFTLEAVLTALRARKRRS